jgi:thymidylate synthase
MKQYHELLQNILNNGTWKNQRAVDKNGNPLKTLSISGEQIKFDLRNGFPILTTKFVPFKVAAVELEGFVKGITSKQWYKDRKCNIWNEWCNPAKIPEGLTKEDRLSFMANEDDLGKFYGYQWTNFNDSGINQLKQAVDTLKTNPTDRRMIISAWNPQQLNQCALHPCHYAYQLISDGEYLDLIWIQRSADIFLGIPFDVVSYAIQLELIAKTTGLIPRYLVGQLGDVHIYENHMDQVNELLSRDYNTYELPKFECDPECDIFNWTYEQVRLIDYKYYPTIKAEVAI